MTRIINLLPPSEQQANRVLDLARQLRDLGASLVLSLVVLAFFLGATRFYLQEQYQASAQTLAQQQDLLNNVETANLKKEVKTLNQDTANFRDLLDSQQNYSSVMTEIAKSLPFDLTVDRLSVSGQKNVVEISGRGASRESVLALRQRLVASPYFKNVNFPLANLQRARNVSWSFRFYVNPEKLRT